MEGYTPSNEEIKEAEGHLTPEQQALDSAREEGYNIGFEKGKRTAYALSTVSKIEKDKTQEFTAKFSLFQEYIFKDFVKQEAENNQVKVIFTNVPDTGLLEVKIKVLLSGSPSGVKRVIQNIQSMAESYNKGLKE